MTLHFNVTGTDRKAFVKAIEELTGIKAKYLGAPSMAYQIGDYKVCRDGSLETEAQADELVEALAKAGFMAEETVADKTIETKAGDKLTIEMPKEKLTDETIENIKKIAESKAGLFKKAFAAEELSITVTDERVSFPWFTAQDADEVKAYTAFIEALCRMAATQKRVTAKEKEVDNEKYAFRCFLLRLGFIGAECKTERKVLLKNLEGSSAFKSGKKGGEE